MTEMLVSLARRCSIDKGNAYFATCLRQILWRSVSLGTPEASKQCVWAGALSGRKRMYTEHFTSSRVAVLRHQCRSPNDI